ncbi:hypothetical protein MBLNU230_g8156t1 [Neophaeotheca triangularis]
MRSSTSLALFATTLLSTPVTLAQSTDSAHPKRGLVYVPSDQGYTEDDQIWIGTDLTWYYNYEASPTTKFDDSQMQFVPMMWGTPQSGDEMLFHDTVSDLIDNGRNISYVLGFNEPDGCGQQVYGGSCMDADTAARLWIQEFEPLKEKYNVSLGAPAVTGSPNGFVWLQSWFTACDGECNPDFIPVHWYGNFEGLASHVGQVNSTYPNMTMWVTEYAMANEDLEESQEFYNMSANWFDNELSYLTHYSYFGSFRSDVSNVGPNAAMLTEDGELTDIGAWYINEPAEAQDRKPSAAPKHVATSTGLWGLVALALVVAGSA